jgi:hypothetical protein
VFKASFNLFAASLTLAMTSGVDGLKFNSPIIFVGVSTLALPAILELDFFGVEGVGVALDVEEAVLQANSSKGAMIFAYAVLI